MPHHVLTAEFFHESNTFKRGLTGLRDFGLSTLVLGQAAIDERGAANTGIGGFLEVGSAKGWHLTHVLSADAEPGGPVSRAAFDHIAGLICDAARTHKPALSGILMALHGAMVTEFCGDGEGELLSRLRAITGPDLPVAITLDLHANATAEMARLADIIVSYKTYPHVDMRDRGVQAGLLLQSAMEGTTRPATLRAHRPMLEETNGGRSDTGPMIPLYARALAAESEPGILAVSINAGFGDADIAEVGPTALVTYDTNFASAEPRARAIAEEIMDAIWANRHQSENTFLTVDEAAAEARAHCANAPLIIADYADNPGSGAYGDATNLLAALLAADIRNATFAPICDPEAAATLVAAGAGTRITLPVGGKCDPTFGGGPLTLTGTVILTSDGNIIGDGPMIGGLPFSFGPTAVFRVGGMDILVVSERGQMLDLQQFRAFGIDPAATSVVALKSMQHFRAAFEPIAARVIVCDSGALSTPRAHLRPYRNVPRPIFPLDPDMVLPGA
jgi:microcystin degradation protein MlrC